MTEPFRFKPYPSCVYHPTVAPKGRDVANEAERLALGPGWYATPADFPKEDVKPAKKSKKDE